MDLTAPRAVLFLVWLIIGLSLPATMIKLAVVSGLCCLNADDPNDGFDDPETGLPPPTPWAVTAVESVFVLQTVHAPLGVLFIRGWRLLALVAGVLLVPLSAWVALHCAMSITGVWL
jgi:hypothetical protein